MPSVANYNIEDNSGANVRIDLNAVFAAIQSSNSESSDLTASKCVAGMPFLNTTSNILKIRNSTNNAFTEIGNINVANLGLLPAAGGTLTGQLLADDSSGASAPALSFDTDTDLGLFRKAANIMGFSSAGTEQMVFDANGITLRSQNEIRFGDADSSNFVAIKAPSAVASSDKTITLPDETGTLLTSATSIATSQLSGTVFTLGSTAVAQGNTVTALPGLHQVTPATNNQYSLGTDALRWSDIFTNDLNLSNEGGQNDIDGTWGSYKIQEGEEHLYLINKRNGKKYKFNLTEVN